jgi:HK97 family phage portal protein
MSYLGDLYKKASGFINAKSYMGILAGNLPSSTRWSNNDFLNSLDISLYTNRAIAKRAEKVGEIEWVVKDKNSEPILGHSILDVLNYPNKYYSGAKFWSLYQIYYDVLGVSYIVKDVGLKRFSSGVEPLEGLHLLRPDLVTPIFSADNSWIIRYEYRLNGSVVPYEPEQIIMVFNPDPKNPLRGWSLLKAGIQAIQTEVQISAYHARVLENGGKVEGVFKFKTPRLTQEQLQQLKDGYDQDYADARKTGKPLFLGGDADYVKTGLSPDELSYLEAKKMTLEDISMMTGVPKVILGSADEIQYSNSDSLYRIFLRETIRPLLSNLATALDRTLVPEGETLTFVDPTPENIEEKSKLIEMAIDKHIISTNEGRMMLAKLTGEQLDDVPGGEHILIPFNLIRLDSDLSAGTDTETDKKKIKSSEIAHPLRDATVRKKYGKAQDKKNERNMVRFKKPLVTYFEEQRDRIIEQLSPEKNYVFRKKDLIDSAMNIELEVKLGKEAFLPMLTEILKESGQDAMELAGSTYAFNLTSDIVSWMNTRTEVFSRTINETTFGQLKDEFTISLAEGESREQLIRRIEDTYDNKITKARATTIARTEVHNANQKGTIEGYRQGNLPIKIWVSVLDGATRNNAEADHVSLDGEEVPLDSPFSNGLMYPGDPRGGPAEVINCRCVV